MANTNFLTKFSSVSTMLKPVRIVLRYCSTSSASQTSSKPEKTNMPIQMTNPFSKEKKKCILCKHRIIPDYKNVQLLSQFVSRFTGKIYTRNITGLCEKQQLAVQFAIGRATKTGLMASYYREPKSAHAPKLFDPDNPFRPHRY